MITQCCTAIYILSLTGKTMFWNSLVYGLNDGGKHYFSLVKIKLFLHSWVILRYVRGWQCYRCANNTCMICYWSLIDDKTQCSSAINIISHTGKQIWWHSLVYWLEGVGKYYLSLVKMKLFVHPWVILSPVRGWQHCRWANKTCMICY